MPEEVIRSIIVYHVMERLVYWDQFTGSI